MPHHSPDLHFPAIVIFAFPDGAISASVFLARSAYLLPDGPRAAAFGAFRLKDRHAAGPFDHGRKIFQKSRVIGQ